MNDPFEHALQNVSDIDKVGITIQNRVNQNDEPVGRRFRRKDHVSGNVIWSVYDSLQLNSTFNALDSLVVTVHSVSVPVGFSRGVKMMGRPLSVMTHHKTSIIEVKAEDNCLADAIIKAKA